MSWNMNEYFNVLKLVIAVCLFAAFLMMFVWMASESLIRRIMHRTIETMDAAARYRGRENRRMLALLEEREGMLYRIEQRLVYSGLARKLSWLTAERWVLLNLILSAVVYFGVLLVGGKWMVALLIMAAAQILVHMAISILMSRSDRAVNDNILKFLDFLGNYSITAGEVTGIFNQISRYLEEPLRSVLDECYYEAQTSGDVNLALLAMAEKIEHPRFKELVRNIEVSLRYSADFTVLVNNSRRLIREDMRTRQERKTLANEALVNMVILVGMSMVILVVVEQLIGTNMKQLLFYSWPGRIALAVIAVIFGLFYLKVHRLDR